MWDFVYFSDKYVHTYTYLIIYLIPTHLYQHGYSDRCGCMNMTFEFE
jgi:hypothetical protein